MSRVLVHLHLYYFDQCDYFIEKLGNINSCHWDLYVSVNQHCKQAEEKILKAFPFAKFVLVENRGYDIWPFIKVLQTAEIEKYDFVLKLHTKNSNPKTDKINGIKYKGFELRDALVNSYLKDRRHFAELIKKLESSKDYGMVCNRAFYKNISEGLPEDLGMLQNELMRIGVSGKDCHFCAGSMLLARIAPYRIFTDREKFCPELFSESGQSHSIGTIAHVYERIISIVVTASGLKTAVFYANFAQRLYLSLFIGVLQPLLENVFALKRVGEDRIKTLVLFGIRIPLEKRK